MEPPCDHGCEITIVTCGLDKTRGMKGLGWPILDVHDYFEQGRTGRNRRSYVRVAFSDERIFSNFQTSDTFPQRSLLDVCLRRIRPDSSLQAFLPPAAMAQRQSWAQRRRVRNDDRSYARGHNAWAAYQAR